MRTFRRFLLSILLVQSVAFAPAALSDPVVFTANGSNVTTFDGDIPVKSIGSLLLPKGSVHISDNTIDVNAVPDWLFDKRPVLSGIVINPKLNNTQNQATLNGLAYFLRGDWLQNLGRNQASEIIRTTDGAVYTGHIGAASDGKLGLLLTDGNRASIAFDQVASISSPRAFLFSIPADTLKIEPADGSYQADARGITFSSATFQGGLAFLNNQRPQAPKSRLPGAEGGISNKIIAQMVLTSFVSNTVAPCIAIPFTFRGATLHDKQLLHAAGNFGSGQPVYAPQILKDGSLNLYPFTNNEATNLQMLQLGLSQGNPLF